jgi:hypothetical protein
MPHVKPRIVAAALMTMPPRVQPLLGGYLYDQQQKGNIDY